MTSRKPIQSRWRHPLHYGYEPSRRYGGYDINRSPSVPILPELPRFSGRTAGMILGTVRMAGRWIWSCVWKLLLSAGHEGTRKDEDLPQLSMPSIRKPETVSGAVPAAAPMTVLKVIPVQNRHLLDYAASRGIDGEIVRKYRVEVHYCFGGDPREIRARIANDHRGFELRNSMFKAVRLRQRILPASGNNPTPFSRLFLTFSVSSSTQGSIRRCPHLGWTCAY